MTATCCEAEDARINSRDAVAVTCRPRPAGRRRTKTALSAALPGATLVDVSGLAGIVEYEPGEYTFTAYAGTRLSIIAAALAEHGQFLPFDPPLVEAGATLGGTVAAGWPGRAATVTAACATSSSASATWTARGQLIKGGGKVVKNAAGFDIPKLMVGSLGMFGVLAELTFKVFPAPRAYATLVAQCVSPEDAVDVLNQVAVLGHGRSRARPGARRADCYAVLGPAGGLADALPERLARLAAIARAAALTVTRRAGRGAVGGCAASSAGRPGRGRWSRCPLTPRRIPGVRGRAFSSIDPGALRRYSGGGQVAWVATAASRRRRVGRAAAGELELSGLVVLGPRARVRLGVRPGEAFERRVKAALDPRVAFPAAVGATRCSTRFRSRRWAPQGPAMAQRSRRASTAASACPPAPPTGSWARRWTPRAAASS